MSQVINFIKLDFNRSNNVTIPTIEWDQGSRFVRVQLQNNNQSVDITGSQVVITVIRNDLEEVIESCNILNAKDGLIEFEISKAMVTRQGDMLCQLKLSDNDSLLSSQLFKVSVNNTLMVSLEESRSDMDVLIHALGEVQDIDNRFNKTNYKIDENYQKVNAQLSEITNEVEYIFPRNYGDVESGDFCIIKANGKVIMIDCYRNDCWGEFKKDLIKEGISHIDYLIITHYHTDHCSNFVNLYNNKFIDAHTNIILPKFSSYYMGLYPTVNKYYTTIKSLCDSNHLNYKHPREGELFEIGNFKIETFNTDIEYYESLTTNYNATSLVQLISHGDTKVLLTSDAQVETLEYLLNTIDLPKLDLYKLEHHGLENITCIPFLSKIRPKFSVQTFGLTDYSTKVLLSRCQTSLWLYNNGCINYGTGISDKLVKFKSTSRGLSVEQGTPFFPNKLASVNTKNIYVNASATNDYIQDGSKEKPFKNLAQAIASIDKSTYSTININIANGTYSAHEYYTNISRIYDISGEIVITGNVTDNSQVILTDGLDIMNCSNVTIQGVTIYSDNYRGISILGSNVFINKVTVTNSANVQSPRNNIFIKNGRLTITDSELSYSGEKSIQCKFSDVILNNITFRNNNIDMLFEYSSYSIKKINTDNTSTSLFKNTVSQNSKPPFLSCSIGEHTTTSTNTETLPLTVSTISDTSCLTVENNAIKIKYGISHAFVSGTILIESGQKVGDSVTFSVWKNNTCITEVQHRMGGTGYESIVIPPTYISLNNNDKITARLRSYSASGAKVKGEHSVSNVSLLVCN